MNVWPEGRLLGSMLHSIQQCLSCHLRQCSKLKGFTFFEDVFRHTPEWGHLHRTQKLFFHSLTSHISAVGKQWDTWAGGVSLILYLCRKGWWRSPAKWTKSFSTIPQPTPLLVSNVSTFLPTHITSLFIHKSWTLLLSLPHSQELCVFSLLTFKYLLGATLMSKISSCWFCCWYQL